MVIETRYCKHCSLEKPTSGFRVSRSRCGDCHREYQTAYTAREPATVRANRLAKAKEWRTNNKEQGRRRINEWNAANREHVRNREQRKRVACKDAVIEAYGGKCVCCGEIETAFLTLDHIGNDGAKHRREVFGVSKGGNMLVWARKNNYPDILQLLCFNCNCGRHVNGGTCPHQQETNLATVQLTQGNNGRNDIHNSRHN